jgi:outer membrane protein OmpA-like peptidoglycan-associated protein
MADYSINERWSLGLELQANLINENYNSKDADNSDWFFNGLVGVKYNLGKTSQKKEVLVPAAPERIIERVVERVVEKPAPVQQAAQQVVEPLRRDVFFTISSTTITAAEMQKVKDIADYLKKYPNATVEITGYADKGTGNATINKNLSAKRAQAVVDALVKNYGVSASRIKSDSKGDTVQPFEEEILNRVSICIAK